MSAWLRLVLPNVRAPVVSMHFVALRVLAHYYYYYDAPVSRVVYAAVAGAWYESIHGGLAVTMVAWLAAIVGDCAHASDVVLSVGHGLMCAQLGSMLLNFPAMHRVGVVATTAGVVACVAALQDGYVIATLSPCVSGLCTSLTVSERCNHNTWYTSSCSFAGACLVTVINMLLLLSLPRVHYLAAAPFTGVCLMQSVVDLCDVSWRRWLRSRLHRPMPGLLLLPPCRSNCCRNRIIVVSV